LVSDTGTAVLTSVDYYFQVKGTGMGMPFHTTQIE
jgi:hypothetical protein